IGVSTSLERDNSHARRRICISARDLGLIEAAQPIARGEAESEAFIRAQTAGVKSQPVMQRERAIKSFEVDDSARAEPAQPTGKCFARIPSQPQFSQPVRHEIKFRIAAQSAIGQRLGRAAFTPRAPSLGHEKAYDQARDQSGHDPKEMFSPLTLSPAPFGESKPDP